MGYTQEEADDIVRDTYASMVRDNARITEAVERINASRLIRGEAIINIPRSISHCGHCGRPTLDHDDETCRAIMISKQLRATAGQFDAALLARVTNMAHELFNDPTRPRAIWWKRLWWRLRSWF